MTASAVRFRPDTGWEFRCEDCTRLGKARFWPLTDEHWNKSRGMRRCRSCWKSYDRAQQLARYAAMPELKREHRRAQQRTYRRATPGQQRTVERLRWEAIKSDPSLLERARVRTREAQRRYRARRAA